MRTTLTIDDDVFQAAQAQARASGKRLGEILSMLARRGLQASAPHAVTAQLPTFNVTPGGPIIPSDRAQQLLADALE